MKIFIAGAAGRMGKEIACALSDQSIATTFDAPPSATGETASRPSSASIEKGLAESAAYIDFTGSDYTESLATLALKSSTPAIVGTTALSEAALNALQALAKKAPVVYAANFSLGVNLLMHLASQAANSLGPAFDKEIFEIHHKHKKDAPSGTALALAEAIKTGSDKVVTKRDGANAARNPGEIAVLAARGGDVIGEHSVFFLGPSERIELTHRATNRRVFAEGAVHAAKWAIGKPPGYYSMTDVLGLAK